MAKQQYDGEMEGTGNLPTVWATDGSWRKVFVGDEGIANDVKFGLYLAIPAADLTKDEGQNTYEANLRAALPEVLAELDRNALHTVFNVARLLALFPIGYIEE